MLSRQLNRAEFHDLADQILQSGYRFRFVARGKSMLPSIQEGDSLEVAPLFGKFPQTGDVILIKAGEDKILAHRVIRKRNRDGKPVFLVKGDSGLLPDGWFESKDILGRIELITRNNKNINLMAWTQRIRARIWTMVALFGQLKSHFPVHPRK